MSNIVLKPKRDWSPVGQIHECLLAINQSNKPVVTLAHGIAVGIAASLTMFCKWPIITRRTTLMTPEILFGFYPNIGSNYTLGKLGAVGLYVGLCAAKLGAIDLMQNNLATNLVDADEIGNLMTDLINLDIVNDENIAQVVDKYRCEAPQSKLNYDKINEHFNANTLKQLFRSLESDKNDWSQKTLAMMKSLSPLALQLTFHLFKQAQLNDLTAKQALQADYDLLERYFEVNQHTSRDAVDGVQAVLGKEGKKTKWHYKTIDDIHNGEFLNYFPSSKHLDPIT